MSHSNNSLADHYSSLVRGIGNVSHQQATRIIGSVVDQVKSILGAMVVAVWVRRSGQDNVDVLQVYFDRGDAQGNPHPPQSIALTPDARGLFAWMALKNEPSPLWLDNIPEDTSEDTTVLVNRLNPSQTVGGQFLNIYKRTREFAGLPTDHQGSRGFFVVEMDQAKSLTSADFQWLQEIAKTTGQLIWRADYFESLSRDANEEIDRFSKIAADRNAKMIHRAVRYTRLHDEHAAALEKFYAVASYDQSVFIMTKYPSDAGTEEDRKLSRVIETVKQELRTHGLEPRLASDRSYHPILWKNIEGYLLGCSRGVAIVENRYSSDLNPNVAMEWGWMRAVGSEVLYLLESQFRPDRADFIGFLSERFEWDFPETSIKSAINKWL